MDNLNICRFILVGDIVARVMGPIFAQEYGCVDWEGPLLLEHVIACPHDMPDEEIKLGKVWSIREVSWNS